MCNSILYDKTNAMESMEELDNEERLRAENEFLKMKMMLENGAQFYMGDPDQRLPAEVEHKFLTNVMEFERQFEEHKTIRVFDKIGRPAHFKPVADLKDDELDKAWEELSGYMLGYGICLDACSPNVSNRELYRFATEEFFEHEISDLRVPGMMHGYIYDEFYPDQVYDNTRLVVGHCMRKLFRKEPNDWSYCLRHNDLRLNEHYPLSDEAFTHLVTNFQDAYESFEEPFFSDVECDLQEKICVVKGRFDVDATIPAEIIHLSGSWQAIMGFDEELAYWCIHELEVEGIEF